MEHVISFATDTATLAVFDPDVLASRADDGCDWWCDDFASLPEVVRGAIALFGLGGDGIFKVRVTSDRLSSAERAYAGERHTLAVQVRSGHLFVGAGEELPGAGDSPRIDDGNLRGAFVSAPIGPHTVEAYGIRWTESPDWYVPDGQPAPESAPADIVLLLSPRTSDFEPPTAEPRMFVNESESWVFPDEPRRVGPEPGMVLTTSVVRLGDALVLKPCGPLRFRPVLASMAGLERLDRVDVRVATVDSRSRECAVELVARRAAEHP